MLTLQALVYIEGNNQIGRPIWNYTTGTLTSWKGAEPDSIIQSTTGKCTPMQVIKQPEHNKLQQLRDKNGPPFRQTMINS